ncbi:MAG: hypothetical protein ACKO2C_05795 [Actinomycetes bacterium]
MIYVASVHWRDPKWVEPQIRFLRRHLPEHRTWAAVDGIPAADAAAFDVALELEGSHPEKLNELAERIAAVAAPDDLILFVDGDAFPIARIDASLLGSLPLAAVRRDENLGDPQPHPCCCLTTVGYWIEIGGDWRRGHTWVNAAGETVSDTGGNLLGILEARGDEWRPLLRTNRVDLHPLWFAVYGDVVYHHGAGFRDPVARVTTTDARERARTAARGTVIPAGVPILGRAERSVRYRAAMRRYEREVAAGAAADRALADEVFEQLRVDDDFALRFTGPRRQPWGSA